MSRIAKALHNQAQLLATSRDELKVQAALFKGEAKTRWIELEEKWDELHEHIGRAKVAAADARPQIEAAAELLAESLKSAYVDFRNALSH